MRPDKKTTTAEDLGQVLGKPANVYEVVANYLYVHENFGIRYYRSKLSKYVDHFDIFLNRDENPFLEPEEMYSGKLMIKAAAISAQTPIEDLERLGFIRRGPDYALDLNKMSVTAKFTEDKTRINYIRIGRRF